MPFVSPLIPSLLYIFEMASIDPLYLGTNSKNVHRDLKSIFSDTLKSSSNYIKGMNYLYNQRGIECRYGIFQYF